MKHSVSIYMTLAIALTIQTFSVGGLNAQDRDRDRDDKDRDHERRLRDDKRNEQWRKKFNAAEYIKSQDKNKDGVLAPEEIDGRRTKQFLEQMGIPTGKSSKVEDLVKSYNSRKANEAQEKRKEFESRLSTLDKFGAETESFGVEQFGTDDKSEGLQSFDESASGMRASDFDPEALEEADKLLSTFDRDENGFLDGDEISRMSWRSPPPETSDLNRDGRLSKMELAKRFTARDGTSQRKRSSRKEYDSKKKSREESSKDDSRSRRGDYGSRDGGRGSRDGDRGYRDRDSRDGGRGTRVGGPESNSTSRDAVAKAKANAKSAQGYAKYVDRSFKKYDVNSDGRLDKEEIAASSLLKKAKDSNRDGFISKQEAIALVSGGKITAPTVTPANTKPTPKKRPVRRTSAGASTKSAGGRTPLSDKDADADGQIQMHEYTDTWTVEKLKEFREKDTNGDGLLSPEEYRGNKR